MSLVETLSPVIIEALTIVILALAGFIGKWLATWAKNKSIDELIITKQKWADLAVRTAEDIYDTGEGDKKLAFASKWLSLRLKEHGIKFTPEEIDGLARASYQRIIGQWEEIIYVAD